MKISKLQHRISNYTVREAELTIIKNTVHVYRSRRIIFIRFENKIEDTKQKKTLTGLRRA